MTLTEVGRFDERVDEGAEVFQMDEDAFRAFYDRTARAVWVYLARISGDRATADDLLQEAYYRFLSARVAFENDAHRRSYLFRIATNLAHDDRRRRTCRPDEARGDANIDLNDGRNEAADRERAMDVRRALGQMKRRDREMLWLAYAEGSSHSEIAGVLGIRAGSVKVLLHRARMRLRRVLGTGWQQRGGAS